MTTPQHQNKIELERSSSKEGGEADQEDHSLSPKHQKSTSHEFTSISSSSSSSPSHEFSFTISIHPSATKSLDKCNRSPFSPADDIFFEGHLLPLQLVSPHKSTTFSDNLRRAIQGDLIDDQKHNKSNNHNCSTTNSASATEERSKHRSFMFVLAKWRKAFKTRENHDDVKTKKKKKKEVNSKVSGILKKYMRLIPALFSKREKEKCDFRRRPDSGNLNLKWKERGGRRELRGRASSWTSPSNSGLVFATAVMASPSESTMEELENGIQAAVAHCKNSIGVKEDKCKG